MRTELPERERWCRVPASRERQVREEVVRSRYPLHRDLPRSLQALQGAAEPQAHPEPPRACPLSASMPEAGALR
ncbi:MAG: hypothetical protein KatS3mg024_0081 [Armatimonadota bacterium]|nr:MAG: hypothetical protein KatS3mg024_0081 [Armatimonadota bacterium]